MLSKLALILTLILLSTPHGFAGVTLNGIKWQKASSNKTGPKLKFAEVAGLDIKPSDKSFSKIRIVLNLANRGAKTLEGAILRCAFSMHIVNRTNPAEAVWSVPVWLDERRVASVKAGQSLDVVIPHVDLSIYLKRLRDTGFWIDTLKVEAMAEPRAGDSLENTVIVSTIPVTGSW